MKHPHVNEILFRLAALALTALVVAMLGASILADAGEVAGKRDRTVNAILKEMNR